MPKRLFEVCLFKSSFHSRWTNLPQRRCAISRPILSNTLSCLCLTCIKKRWRHDNWHLKNSLERNSAVFSLSFRIFFHGYDFIVGLASDIQLQCLYFHFEQMPRTCRVLYKVHQSRLGWNVKSGKKRKCSAQNIHYTSKSLCTSNCHTHYMNFVRSISDLTHTFETTFLPRFWKAF